MIKKERYDVHGMSCAACSARVDKAVRKLDGVNEVNVNLLTNSMDVSFDDKVVTRDDIIRSVTNAGYGASIKDKKNEQIEDKDTKRILIRLIISIILLIPLFYLGMGHMLSWPLFGLEDNLLVLASIELVLSLAIMIINKKFFVSGFKAIIHKSMNMDTLVALGSGVAFLYSFIIFIIMIVTANKDLPLMDKNDALMTLMMNISFETAGMVPTLITIGKTLESYSKGKTTNAIKSLMDLSPKTATIMRNGKEIIIPVEEVKINDTFIVKPGEIIPVDGIIIDGFSSIDESALTGESLPIDKTEGDLLRSGTLNHNGVLTCRATRVGENTTINQIIKMVEEAGSSKAKISKIADKVSAIFVPVVIILALLTFTVWMIVGNQFVESHTDIHSNLLSYSIERAVAILVVSCPCALGLATPVAIMVGNGKAAKNGILFKNAEAIEETGKIKYLVLDKTGTITKGEPVVTDIIPFDISEKELLEFAYLIEHKSEHPLSKAITNYFGSNNTDTGRIKNFQALPGRGVEAVIDEQYSIAGNIRLLKEKNIDISNIIETIEKYEKQGKNPLIFVKNSKIIGIIVVSDVIKDDSINAINKIKKMGIIPIMLTGDNAFAARFIANQVGIDYVLSEAFPEDKLVLINELKKYDKVAMVGDGINDSAALTSADIGIAIGQGSDIAIESADVVLMKSTLVDVYGAINLSKKVLLNIKENLFWAFFYNIIMIPIAAGLFSFAGLYKLAPWMGSAAMALSSVCVVLNALRLNLVNIYKDKIIDNNSMVDINGIINTLKSQKGETNNMEKVFNVKGMMCMHCVSHVKKALESVDGVKEADVSLKENTAKVMLEKDVPDQQLKDAIINAGYEVE